MNTILSVGPQLGSMTYNKLYTLRSCEFNKLVERACKVADAVKQVSH